MDSQILVLVNSRENLFYFYAFSPYFVSFLYLFLLITKLFLIFPVLLPVFVLCYSIDVLFSKVELTGEGVNYLIHRPHLDIIYRVYI